MSSNTINTEETAQTNDAAVTDFMFFVRSFGFLLPRRNITSAKDFAAIIKVHYDTQNPKTHECVRFLENYPGEPLIESTWQGFKVCFR